VPLSDPQRSTLAFLLMAGWSTALGVADWRGCSLKQAEATLDSLRRRGLVTHSHLSDHWQATARAKTALRFRDDEVVA
jgi:hypothetical protein